jgi:hypothetical protein
VKTLSQKLIKIDILLSHVKLHRASSEQKKLSKKKKKKIGKMVAALQAKPTRIGKTKNRSFGKPTVGRFSVY